MPRENTERIKLYIVVGLSLVFVIIGYFRLFHKKTNADLNSVAHVETESDFNLSSIESKIINRTQVSEMLSVESFQPIARDIFTSFKSA